MIILNASKTNAELNITDANGKEISKSVAAGDQISLDLSEYQQPFSVSTILGDASCTAEELSNDDSITVKLSQDGSAVIEISSEEEPKPPKPPSGLRIIEE